MSICIGAHMTFKLASTLGLEYSCSSLPTLGILHFFRWFFVTVEERWTMTTVLDWCFGSCLFEEKSLDTAVSCLSSTPHMLSFVQLQISDY